MDKKAANTRRQVGAGSAANKQPFKDPTSHGMKASPPTNGWGDNKGWVSAEEFPFASTMKGGPGYVVSINQVIRCDCFRTSG